MNNNKVALVTGGNRGIGLAIVKGLSEHGFNVVLGCRDINTSEALAKSIGANVVAVELDLSSYDTRQRAISNITKRFPKIDVLINNAGVLEDTPFTELSSEALMSSMQTNAFAAFELTQYFANQMVSNGYGRIVNISSGWGAFSDGLTGPAAYSISKATLNAMTKVAANSYNGDIKINAMCPGWVRTDMGGMSATRSPEEGAETAIWLAMLGSDAPTGQFFRDKKQIDW
ncbi:short chain dehydrogenase [Vibrio maritimus]|uniref:Short chain dehydrogenase n=1 Tax=Vibrio maritimus TaxID=990268 RepID=A0A090T774_9VIBR|nr:short chain dehydrogenase [Vibrio maritimus]